jgi:hypothetical protein
MKTSKGPLQCYLLLAKTREIVTEVFTLFPKFVVGAYRYGIYGNILSPIPGFAWDLFFF